MTEILDFSMVFGGIYTAQWNLVDYVLFSIPIWCRGMDVDAANVTQSNVEGRL